MIRSESDWFHSNDPAFILQSVRDRGSDRQLRLFAAASFRRIAHLYSDPRFEQGIETLERVAEGTATRDEKRRVPRDARLLFGELARSNSGAGLGYLALSALMLYRSLVVASGVSSAFHACDQVVREAFESECLDPDPDEAEAQCHILRDIFGGLAFEVAIDPLWLTSTVIGLTRTIYDDKRFDVLPILGDALEDAGCSEPIILGHCREGLEHYRGCWVLDALLERLPVHPLDSSENPGVD